ncbi:pseudouridine synthase [Virgibacillus pantothenticus]|uniref:Pseudouridine synthase n=1 Tax=Virgibacillus pantothenticus TaxID=1473 RepID=A0A0L0QNK0_VIRPA|nr:MULTISPECIES: RluA family pseudouridine synthase [Virgibacillus]API93814.1 pseudouridine synthase [Virgibacillus sp. 6R]KNE20099.1 pseudouridine synthase [Virgibacillus pantothenticus]MBS7427642.1 RluA family pseudouridine synthase [Virgibacillus sp. 19R1-5]MBU8565867.1 RluA family pseudouridine synthase [Virgibacillus pantothenticus]MBU8601084.1 RluA family pseudouridine synthase [Virgibacillus pantothenticus]
MTKNKYIVREEDHKSRIDKLLADQNREISRSRVQSWITDAYVTVNGKPVKANYKCQQGDLIEWIIPKAEPLSLVPEAIALDIVYEDKDILVVNKPKGMVVHPSAGHQHGTLVHALLYHCTDLSGINGVERPGIVHRLDKDTSGLLVVAKHDEAHQQLAEQLVQKTMKRTYQALVHGEIAHEKGMIEAPIGRDPKDRQKMSVVENGKEAITHFRVLRAYPDYSHVECQLETGRTHQIRVHMKYIGYPIVGDPKYGPRKTLQANGQVLHAKELRFYHPISKQPMHFSTDLPAYFQELLAYIQKLY